MNAPSILVIGSANTDMVIKAPKLPYPGETILGGSFFMNAGGKGANQAVAAARLGGNVTFIAKTGNDIFGKQAVKLFEAEGINTSHILTDALHPSGVALITVDEKGENCIVVAPGANATLNANDLQHSSPLIECAEVILLQLEIPLGTVEYIVRLGSKNNKKIILNPAPAQQLSDTLLKHISVITPNQKEAELLTGIRVYDEESAVAAALTLAEKGIANIIITMGAMGALVYSNGQFAKAHSPKVQVVDTTAAGDVFNGALAVALSQGKDMIAAAEFACKAAAVSVTRLGAQASAPTMNEVSLWL